MAISADQPRVRERMAVDLVTASDMVRSFGAGDILVDFDHTLFGANSSEEYLRFARPAFLTSILLFVIRGLVPWQRLAGRRWYRVRDYVAIVTVTLLMPWNLIRWRRSAPGIFSRHAAQPLIDALARRDPGAVTIVSFGFDALIGPLLRGSPLQDCRRTCVAFATSPQTLRLGKLAVLERDHSRARLGRATMITDSEEDADVLDVVGRPILVDPVGENIAAEASLYLPLRYMSTAKYSRRFVIQQVFLIEAPIVLLGLFAAIMANWMILPITVLLFLSLYTIYEIGYFENDHMAARTESQPVVSTAAALYRDFAFERHAWPWAIVLGFAACLLSGIAPGEATRWERIAANAAIWSLVLVGMRGLFHMYNRRPPARRMLIYPFLQAAKLFGVFAILTPSLFGIALGFAQIVMMWMNYAIYRAGGDKSAYPREGVRFVAFVILAGGLVAAHGALPSSLEAMIAAIMLAWSAGRLALSKLAAARVDRNTALVPGSG